MVVFLSDVLKIKNLKKENLEIKIYLLEIINIIERDTSEYYK